MTSSGTQHTFQPLGNTTLQVDSTLQVRASFSESENHYSKKSSAADVFGNTPEIYSRSISITNLPSDVTEEFLRLFFENSRRSGGGRVVDIVVTPDEDWARVTFENTESMRMLRYSYVTICINKYFVFYNSNVLNYSF